MTVLLASLTGPAALAINAAALVVGALTLAVTRRPALALSVLLDLFLAAGLLRLAGEPSWQTIAMAAAIVGLRRLIGVGLRLGASSWPSSVGGHEPPSSRSRAVRHLLRPAWRR